MLGLNFNVLSLGLLLSLIMVDPENSLKISFCHFSFNLILAVVSLIAPRQIVNIVESSLPFKTSVVGVLWFTLFQAVPEGIIRSYDILIYLIEPIYAIFEVWQVTNLAFLISRRIKEKMSYKEEGLVFEFPIIIALLTSVTWLFLSIWLYYACLITYELTVVNMIIITAWILISVFLLTISILSATEDSNIMNGWFLSLFLAYTTKVILKKRDLSVVITAESLSYTSTVKGLLEKAYKIQKRLSQYLSSFIFSGNSIYSISGFFEFNKQENIIAIVIGLVMLVSLPLTKYEWFNDGSEPEEKIETEKPRDEKVEIYWEERKYHCFYYILNSLLVLLTTNYALKSLDYSNSSENYGISMVSSFLQPVVGLGYFIFKLSVSQGDEH